MDNAFLLLYRIYTNRCGPLEIFRHSLTIYSYLASYFVFYSLDLDIESYDHHLLSERKCYKYHLENHNIISETLLLANDCGSIYLFFTRSDSWGLIIVIAWTTDDVIRLITFVFEIMSLAAMLDVCDVCQALYVLIIRHHMISFDFGIWLMRT